MIPFTGRQGDRLILLVLRGYALLIVRREHPLKDPHQACLYHPTHGGSYKFLAFPPAFWLGGVFLCCVCLFLSLGCQRSSPLHLLHSASWASGCPRGRMRSVGGGGTLQAETEKQADTAQKGAPETEVWGGKLRICTTHPWVGWHRHASRGVLRGCSRCAISKK